LVILVGVLNEEGGLMEGDFPLMCIYGRGGLVFVMARWCDVSGAPLMGLV